MEQPPPNADTKGISDATFSFLSASGETMDWSTTIQFVEFLLAAFVGDRRPVPLSALSAVRALAIELPHMGGRDLRIQDHAFVGSHVGRSVSSLAHNRRAVAATIRRLVDKWASRAYTGGSSVAASLLASRFLDILRQCCSTHAVISIACMLSAVTRSIWGNFSQVRDGDKVSYVKTGIERFMCIFGQLVPPRAVVRANCTVKKNDHVGALWFSTCQVEAAPMGLSFGMTLPRDPKDNPFLSTNIVPSPRRSAHAAATSILLSLFENPVLKPESTVDEVAARAADVKREILRLANLIRPRARATRGLDKLDPKNINFVQIRPSSLKKVSPLAIPILTFSGWVVKSFEDVPEDEEILLGVETKPYHVAVAMRHYAKFCVRAPIAERVAAVMGTALILGDCLQLPSVFFDILVQEDGDYFPMHFSRPDLVSRWTVPEQLTCHDLPRVPSPVDVASWDTHLLDAQKTRRSKNKRRHRSNGRWSVTVDKAMMDLD